MKQEIIYIVLLFFCFVCEILFRIFTSCLDKEVEYVIKDKHKTEKAKRKVN